MRRFKNEACASPILNAGRSSGVFARKNHNTDYEYTIHKNLSSQFRAGRILRLDLFHGAFHRARYFFQTYIWRLLRFHLHFHLLDLPYICPERIENLRNAMARNGTIAFRQIIDRKRFVLILNGLTANGRHAKLDYESTALPTELLRPLVESDNSL